MIIDAQIFILSPSAGTLQVLVLDAIFLFGHVPNT